MDENIYFKCRKAAAACNEKLNSRSGAAELLGISESSLAHYELGITKTVPADVIVMMAELYNAPELRNWYCASECPIGKRNCTMATEEKSIEHTVVNLLCSIGDDDLNGMSKKLLDIASDGVVTAKEAAEIEPIQQALNKVVKAISELQIICEKAKRTGDGAKGET